MSCDVDIPIEVTFEATDNHVHYARAPHYRHHHHHYDHYHRGLRTGRSEPENDLSASATSVDDERVVQPRAHRHHGHHEQYEKVIVTGDHDHVHLGRSPHHHHHHHHHGRYVAVSGDYDHVRVDRSPRSPHHYHHYNGHEKVIISGDHDHVHVERSPDWRHSFADGKAIISSDNDYVHGRQSVLIAGEQGQSYVVPRLAKRIAKQEMFTIPSLGKRAGDEDCVPGHIVIIVRIYLLGGFCNLY